jgi:hypothetical protein
MMQTPAILMMTLPPACMSTVNTVSPAAMRTPAPPTATSPRILPHPSLALAAQSKAQALEASKPGDDCSELLELLGRSEFHAMVLGELSVCTVWRLRGVSRAFRGWCGSALAAMPGVVAVGGRQDIGGGVRWRGQWTMTVSLDLATLAWRGASAVSNLPTPCEEVLYTSFSLGQLPEERLVAAGGLSIDETTTTAAFEWAPGRAAWTPLPPMRTARAEAAPAVRLLDGHLLVAGGFTDDGKCNDEHDPQYTVIASVEVPAADGSGWAALPPMAAARHGAATGRLLGGQVIVAGGGLGNDDPLASAELWDPTTGAWAALPRMAQLRYGAVGCVLPSGRFAVLGGADRCLNGDAKDADINLDPWRTDAEAFDLVSRAWQPLPRMPHDFYKGAAVAVAGGLLAVGGEGHAGAMLFEEESGRWFTLPGQMPTSRIGHVLMTKQTAAS